MISARIPDTLPQGHWDNDVSSFPASTVRYRGPVVAS